MSRIDGQSRLLPGPYETWSNCSTCGFQGGFVFHCHAGEAYDDPHRLGGMMDTRCPACGSIEAVLVPSEQLLEMRRFSERGYD